MKRLYALLLGLLIGSVTAMWSASVALAHAGLESSSPAPSATLESSPVEIVLDFSEPVSSIDRSIELFDESLERIETPDPVMFVADRVEIRDVPPLRDGLYLVAWRVQSQDGHVAQGAFTFQVGTDSSTAGASSTTAEELLARVAAQRTGPDGLDVVRALARALSYLGLAGAVGTLAFAVATGLQRIRWVVGIGWTAVAMGTVLQFMAQGVYVSGGTWSDLIDSRAWRDVSSTRLGQGLILRAVLIVALAVFVLVRSRRPSVDRTTWWRSSCAVVAGGILATFAATGHASASSPAALAAGIDGVHLASVVIWIGGLLGIVFGDRRAEIVNSFSRAASFALPIAVVTGTIQAWHLVDDVSDLSATRWGRSLVVKIVFVLVAATLGALARLVVRADRSAPVRRLVAVEVVAALGIIAATSVLVASPPRIAAEPAVMTATLAQDDIIANFTVTPGLVGVNEIHVTVVTPGGSLDPVDDVEIRLTQESSDLPPISVDVTSLGPNHFLGSVSILRSGDWVMELLVRVTPARIVRLSTTLAF